MAHSTFANLLFEISDPTDLENAHPGRYLFFHKDFEYFRKLKGLGLELQVNALSLTDHYGKSIRKVAEKLIDNNMIDFMGTDIHHVRHLEILKKVPN